MNWLVLLFGLGLGALWIIGLIMSAATSWYLWLTFVAAVALVIIGSTEGARRLRGSASERQRELRR